VAVGFTLTQEKEGNFCPILYGGRSLTTCETNYCTTDKELLGLFYAVKKSEFYITDQIVIVYTDHKPLIYLLSFRDIVNKRYRWIEYIENIGVIIRYIEGKENVTSGYISKNLKCDTENEKLWKPSVNTVNISDFEKDSFIAQQRNDAEIRAVLDHVEGNESC